MDISKNNVVRFILSFTLLGLCYLKANAQQRYDSLWKPASKFQNLTNLTMSSDGQWAAARLSYEDNSDTLLVYSTSSRQILLGKRVSIEEPLFLGGHHLLLSSMGKAELWDLKKNTSINFEDIVKIVPLDRNLLAVLQGQAHKHRLTLYDTGGKALQSMDEVSNFWLHPNGFVSALSQTGSTSKCDLLLLSAFAKKKLLSSAHAIEYVEMDHSGKGMLISTRDQATFMQQISYLDIKTLETYNLKDILPLEFRQGLSEVLPEEGSFFLRLQVKKENDNSLLDIWYGNDDRLQEKFFRQDEEHAFIWQPAKKMLQKISGNFPKNVCLGNGRYYLSFDPYHLQDYTLSLPNIKASLYDAGKLSLTLLDTLPQQSFVSGSGKHLLAFKKEQWHLYSLTDGKKYSFVGKGLTTPFFSEDGRGIVFESNDGVWYYDIHYQTLKKIIDTRGYATQLVNTKASNLRNFGFIQKTTVNLDAPLLFRTFDVDCSITSYHIWYKGKTKTVVAPTSNRITLFCFDSRLENFSYIEENYNLPPRLVHTKRNATEKLLFKSNADDLGIKDIRQEIISYSSGEGTRLQGVLFYPAKCKENLKYPMVVHIYEKQGSRKNSYLHLTGLNGTGLNTRALLEMGYFVYYPDIEYGPDGPGISALQCVVNSLTPLAAVPQIDTNKIGLIGQSFGGYQTNFIATQSDRFAAYISGTAPADIVNTYHSFNNNSKAPEFWRFESGQFRMHQAFSENKELYFNNNPIYYAQSVNAPILLWTGDKDENVRWEDTRTFYDALRRNGKTVIALFYKGEGHSLQQKDAMHDLSSRVIDWLEYFLKGNANIEWITEGTKKGVQ
jgi:dipeptidyl aminopeptidase/acylaminoacyl peptidase